MNLLNMTFRNVQRNFRVYTIYLFAMITGVMVHFTFSSLMYNQDILDVLNNKESFQTGVSIASVVIFLFIIFFILYANSFFMKQRKRRIPKKTVDINFKIKKLPDWPKNKYKNVIDWIN
ncbi:hypothetical protein [Peribacillus sp. N1]